MVECLGYLMTPDNLQQPPHELQLAEAESGGGLGTVQGAIRTFGVGKP